MTGIESILIIVLVSISVAGPIAVFFIGFKQGKKYSHELMVANSRLAESFNELQKSILNDMYERSSLLTQEIRELHNSLLRTLENELEGVHLQSDVPINVDPEKPGTYTIKDDPKKQEEQEVRGVYD